MLLSAFCYAQSRVRDERYDAVVDEILTALRQRYGPSLLLHWEDFAASNAFRLLSRYRAMVILPGQQFHDVCEAINRLSALPFPVVLQAI